MADPKSGATAASAAVRMSWATRGIDVAAGLACAALVLVVSIQVIGRLADAPVSWSEELTRAIFIWMVFIGMASSMRAADAARVTVLLLYVPWLRRLALPIYVIGCLAFFLLMAWTGFGLVRQQVMMGETIATLGVSSWAIGITMPISAVIAAWGTVASLRDHRAVVAVQGERER